MQLGSLLMNQTNSIHYESFQEPSYRFTRTESLAVVLLRDFLLLYCTYTQLKSILFSEAIRASRLSTLEVAKSPKVNNDS